MKKSHFLGQIPNFYRKLVFWGEMEYLSDGWMKMESFFLCQEHFWNHGMLTDFKNPDTKKTDFHCNYYYHLPPNTSQQRLSPSLGNERKLSATNGVDHSIFAATGLHHEFGITRLSNTFIREYGHLQATHFYKRLQEWYRPLPSKGRSQKKTGKCGNFDKKKILEVYPNLTSFVIWPRRFRHAKFIFRC